MAVHVSEAFGAKVTSGQLTDDRPVIGSRTLTLVRAALPVLVTR